MKCPYCGIAIRLEPESRTTHQLKTDRSLGIQITAGFCPECSEFVLLLDRGTYRWIDDDGELSEVKEQRVLFPPSAPRLADKRVPRKYLDAFNEANSIVSLSPKASAALSRRLLQQILREEYKIQRRDLAEEIEELKCVPRIPEDVRSAVDAIRNVGNFAAHPLKLTNSGEIAEVEAGEAEWCLEVIAALLEVTFVRPAIEKERKDRLNAKLADLRKPPMKS
jgi:hypothetical protein